MNLVITDNNPKPGDNVIYVPSESNNLTIRGTLSSDTCQSSAGDTGWYIYAVDGYCADKVIQFTSGTMRRVWSSEGQLFKAEFVSNDALCTIN